MQRILRSLLAVVAVIAATTALVACGGSSSGSSASSGTDVNTLLDKTFSGSKKVKSGKVDLSLDVTTRGAGSTGPVAVKLSGPFESQGAKQLPKFDFSLEASAQGQDIKAGAESTGDKGFVTFNGTDYAVSDLVFQQFKAGYEQSAARRGSGQQASLASLGLHPRQWLTNPKKAGEAKVGGTDVIRITGGLDVSRFLDDVDTALSRAGSLGVSNTQLPGRLTDRQKQQVEKAVKTVSVEIDTGKDDTIMRRMKVDVSAVNPDTTGETATIGFDLQLLDLNQGQSFAEPSNTKPFDQLLQQFGGIGALGALGAASGSGSSPGSATATSQQKVKKYSECLQKAGSDTAKQQKCASVLNP